MLVHIPATREELYVMSFPRDMWVPIPGHGEAKINAAFSYGGPTLLIQTVEQLTGIRIDHIVVVDFTSFAAITDMLGGVDITIPAGTFDRRRGEEIPAGTYRMDGAEALAYVRQRHGLPGGDLDRVQRHQNWLRAVALGALGPNAVGNPADVTRTLVLASRSVAVDEDFTVQKQRDLALSLRGIRGARDLHFLTAPVAGLGRSPDGKQSIVVVDHERLAEISSALANDTIVDFLNNHTGEFEPLGSVVR
jgi:LCP family protein required for cell wall assembly